MSDTLGAGHLPVADQESEERGGGRPGFWEFAPNIFLVNFSHFRGLFQVFGQHPPPLDPPLPAVTSLANMCTV